MVGGGLVGFVVPKQSWCGREWLKKQEGGFMCSRRRLSQVITSALVGHAVTCERTEISMGTICSAYGYYRVSDRNEGHHSELSSGTAVILYCVCKCAITPEWGQVEPDYLLISVAELCGFH